MKDKPRFSLVELREASEDWRNAVAGGLGFRVQSLGFRFRVHGSVDV